MKVILSIFLAFSLAAPQTTNAGPVRALVKLFTKKEVEKQGGKIITERVITSTTISATLLTSVSALLVAYELSQFEGMEVAPEVAEAKKTGATFYNTKICRFEGHNVAVPAGFSHCPDGTSPQHGPKLDLSGI